MFRAQRGAESLCKRTNRADVTIIMGFLFSLALISVMAPARAFPCTILTRNRSYMDVLLERIPSIVKEFEAVRRRPDIFIGKIESKSMEHYICGFRWGAHHCAYMKKYLEKHRRIVEQVAYDRGWTMTPEFVKSIRTSGLSEKEIIEEMLSVEIES